MSFTLNIETGNAEMSEPSHVAEALRKAAEQLDEWGDRERAIFDLNGNTVGSWTLDLPPEPEPLTPEEIEACETWTEIVNNHEENDRLDEYPGLDLIDRYETERRED